MTLPRVAGCGAGIAKASPRTCLKAADPKALCKLILWIRRNPILLSKRCAFSHRLAQKALGGFLFSQMCVAAHFVLHLPPRSPPHLLIFDQVLLPKPVHLLDAQSPVFSSCSDLLEEQEFLPVVDLERFLISKWKRVSHFHPYYSPELASLVNSIISDRQCGISPHTIAHPPAHRTFDLSLSLSTATCASVSASPSNAQGILNAARHLIFEVQSCIGSCDIESVYRLFDSDAAVQISSLGRQLLLLPSFGLSSAECTTAALQLALYSENFPLLCRVMSHVVKSPGKDESLIVKTICESGACQYSEVLPPLSCKMTDLSQGPSFSLPVQCDFVFDCIVAMLSGKMHCLISAVRAGRHVILDYTLPETALSRSESDVEDSDAALQSFPVASASPHLKGALRASGIDAILEQGNSPFARTGFSDQVVAMIAEGVASDQLSSYLTEFLGDENVVSVLIEWVQASLPNQSVTSSAIPQWKRSLSGCFGKEVANVFDGPPTIINYLGAILIVDASNVRRFDGSSLASVPEYTWVSENQRQFASTLHHGSHCVVGRMVFVASAAPDQSFTLIQACDPSNEWNVKLTHRIKVPFCHGLTYHLGELFFQQNIESSSIIYISVPLSALLSTKFQGDLVSNDLITGSIRCHTYPSSRVRFSDDKYFYSFHDKALDDSLKSCTVTFFVDPYSHSQFNFDWLPPINEQVYQLCDFVSSTTPLQGNSSHERICTYNGWALARSQHPEIKDTTVILDRPVSAINRERYFEVVINQSSENDGISLGLCHSGYEPLRSHPGWYPSSVAYHGDDGRFYVGDPERKHHSASVFVRKGEVAGCGILDHDLVFFTRNGILVGVFYIPGSSSMHPAIGGRKDDSADSGNECTVRLAPPFSFEPANMWPQFARMQSIIERSWPTQLSISIPQNTIDSSVWDLCSSFFVNLLRSAQIEFESSRIGAYRGALVFTYNSAHWNFVSQAVPTATSSSHNPPSRGDRRSRSSRQERRNARNEASDRAIEPPAPDVADSQVLYTRVALPSVLEINCNGSTHVELFICPSSFIGSVAFKLSQDASGSIPLGNPSGYASPGPIPGFCDFPSVIIPCNHFYVQFSVPKDDSFYSVSVVALPLAASGSIRIDDSQTLIEFLTLLESCHDGHMSCHSSLSDSLVSILRIQVMRGWLQLIISKETPNSPCIQLLIRILTTILNSSSVDAKFLASGLFLHCLSVSSFLCSVDASQMAQSLIQISRLASETDCSVTSFLETGFISIAFNLAFWNNFFQNSNRETLQSVVSTLLSLALWHKRRKISEALTHSFHTMCKTFLLFICSGNTSNASLRLHFMNVLRDAAQTWSSTDGQSLISESFLSCVVVPVFLIFDVEYVSQLVACSLIELLKNISAVVEILPSKNQFHSMRMELMTVFNLGLSLLIRSAEYCFLSSQPWENNSLSSLMSSELFSLGFISSDDHDFASKIKLAMLRNDSTIQRIFDVLNDTAGIKTDFSKIEHRTSAFLFLSASGFFPFFLTYDEQSMKTSDAFHLNLQSQWQEYLSCTKDCWLDSAVFSRANICIDLRSLNSFNSSYPVEYDIPSAFKVKTGADEDGLLSQLLNFIKSDASPGTVTECITARQHQVAMRLQGLFILKTFVEHFDETPGSLSSISFVSNALLKFMSNDAAATHVLGDLHFHPELNLAYSAFMTSFTKACIKSSASQISRACIMYMSKLLPNDETWAASESFQRFLQQLTSLNSPHSLIDNPRLHRRPGINLPHSFSACYLPSGQWICHGGLECVNSVLMVSSQFWMRDDHGDWHLLETVGQVPICELALTGHTLTTLPNGTIAIIGGYSNDLAECMQKVFFANVDIHKKSVYVRHIKLSVPPTAVQPMDHSVIFDPSNNCLIVVGGCSTKFKPLSQCLLVSVDLSNMETSPLKCKLLPEPGRGIVSSPLGRKPALCLSQANPSNLFVFHGDCRSPAILEFDFRASTSETWKVRCSVQPAGIGRSLFVTNDNSWILYGGYSIPDEGPLCTICISSSNFSISPVEFSEPIFMRHFISNSCVAGCSHQDFYQVLDGGSNTKCQQLVRPGLFEFNPSCIVKSKSETCDSVVSANIKALLRVLAIQSVRSGPALPKSLFSSIWNHYAQSFSKIAKHITTQDRSLQSSGITLIDKYFILEQWNGTITSESGHATLGSWCWVSSSSLSKPAVLFSLSRNVLECCSVRICESRHLEVISTTPSKMTKVIFRSDHPLPSSQWVHVALSVKCCATFQCKLFLGGHPIGPWSTPNLFINATSRNSDDGKFFENASFAVCIPSCDVADTDSIILYNLAAVDSVNHALFNDWSLSPPPAWDETQSMIHQFKYIISVFRSAGSPASSVILETSGFLSSMVLALLDGPNQVAIDCALYFSEVSGSFSVEELDAAVSQSGIQECSFVLAVLSRIRNSLRFCLSRVVSLLRVLHLMFKSNPETRRVVFQDIRPLLVTESVNLPLSDELCSDICIAFAIISGDFLAAVPGSSVQLNSCHGFLKTKSFDEVHVLHLDHDDYVISAFPIASISRDGEELTVEEDVYLPVCKLCLCIMTLCIGFRNSTGIDLNLEFAANSAIRTIRSLNPVSCNSSASQEMNAHLMRHLLMFSQDLNGVQDLSSDFDNFVLFDHVQKLKCMGLKPINLRAITNQSVSPVSPPRLFEPLLGPLSLDTKREPGRSFMFETRFLDACSIVIGFIPDRALKELIHETCSDFGAYPFCSTVTMTRATFPNSSSRDAKISREECSSGVMWASFQIDLNHFLLGLLTHGCQPDIRQNSERHPRFIGSEVPQDAVAGERLPSVTSADICTLVLDFNAHSLSFYKNAALALSLPIGAGPYHIIFQGFVVSSCIKPLDSDSDIIQSVLKRHGDNTASPWSVGTRVTLSPHYENAENAVRGPLKPGDFGSVRQVLGKNVYLVEAGCQECAYPRHALMKDHLSSCWSTSIDLPAPTDSKPSVCAITAAWCDSSAFKFEAHIDGHPVTLAPPSVPPKETLSDVWWPFVMTKCGSPSISFSSKSASNTSERMSSCERIFHRRLIRRKRYREHALALAKRLSAWAHGVAEKASQLVSDHRKFRDVTEVEFWILLHPSKRDRASWLKELFEFGVRTRVAWKACERQSDVQSAGVWATDDANANSLPADSQSEDDEPSAGLASSIHLPPTVPVSNKFFVAQTESLKGDRRNSLLSSHLCSQGEDDEPTTLKYEDPYSVLVDSSVDLNGSKSNRLVNTGLFHAGNVDITLLGICDSIMAASASHALNAIVKTLHQVNMNDSQHIFSSIGSLDLVSFLFNFISSDNMLIQFASQVGGLLDSVLAIFGMNELERFLCCRIVKDVRSCSRCLQFLKVTALFWHKYDILNSPSCINCLTDALLTFSSPHIRVNILHLFSVCASQFIQSATYFQKFFRVLNAGYTFTCYSGHLDIASPTSVSEVVGPVVDSDQHSFMQSSHAAVKSLCATPAVQTALFEFIVRVLMLSDGRDLVSPILYNSIPASFIRAAWSISSCKPLVLCSFVPDISSILEAFEILSLSEVAVLPATGSKTFLPAFAGASGIKIILPAIYGSFSVCWPDGRLLTFLPSTGSQTSPNPGLKSPEPAKKCKVPCRHWASSSSCKFGLRCRFDHSPTSDSALPRPASPSAVPVLEGSGLLAAGGGGAVSQECRQSVAESIAAFEGKLRFRGANSPRGTPPSQDKVVPLLEVILEGQPDSIVFHHDAFGVSVAPLYIPCFSSVQDLAFKDPSSEDITTGALALCVRHGMFDHAVKVLNLIAVSGRIPSLAEHSLAIASCNARCIDQAIRVLDSMQSCGQTASCEVVHVLADCCARAGQFALANDLVTKYKGRDATNFFGLDTEEFSKRVWPLILECIAAKSFNLCFGAHTSSISCLLAQFTRFLPSPTIRAVVQQSIAGASEQGGRFEATLSRFKASKAKCKGNSDDGTTVFSQLMDIVAQKGIRTFRCPFMEAPFEVKFKGEDGRDRIDRQGGGLFRECCSLLCAELQSAALPIFIKLPDCGTSGAFVFRSSLPATLRGQRLLQFLGALMGMALHCGEPLNLDLDASAWIAILGLSQCELFSSASDRMHPAVKVRHERIESLKQLMLCGETVFDDTVALGGDWEFSVQSLEGELIDLVPQGRHKTVAFNNCRQLISSLESFVENEMRDCARHVQQGLCRVVPLSSLLLLRWDQFEEMVCGQREVTWEALRSCLRCGSGYHSMRDAPVQLLCESLSAFSSQQRAMFLRFVSGRSRLPRAQSSPGSEQCIHIIKCDVPAKSSPDSYLPKAHTCFFQLELPAYSSAAVCRQRLLYAICNCHEVDGEHQRALRAEDLAEFQ